MLFNNPCLLTTCIAITQPGSFKWEMINFSWENLLVEAPIFEPRKKKNIKPIPNFLKGMYF